LPLNRNLRNFLFPSLTPRFFLRVGVLALCAYLFFGHVCIPFRIQGLSMAPTYGGSGLNFCWTPRFLFSPPERHNTVLVRFAGNRVMLLKRVVGLENEQVEFRAGKLFINGVPIEEPYVRYPCKWDLSPRMVKPGHVYVVGDNRDMPMENHSFGQADLQRIRGGPLW